MDLESNLENIKEDTDLFGETHQRLSVAERIGFVPISVWKPNWSESTRLKAIIGDTGDTRKLVGKKMKLMGSKYEVSIFNPSLAQMILSAYCPPQAKIYDAFGGGGTRGFIATAMGHSYTGIEIRQEEVDRIKRQQDELKLPFEIVCADSTQYAIEQNSFDFSLSCPPYYDLEVYSEQAGDISNLGSYEEFLALLKLSLGVTYEGLKPGALCVWVVGNFRSKTGELRHFNGDVVQLAKQVGFKLHDELIWWGASGSAALRAGAFTANRKSVRVHEYLLILKK